MIKLIKNQYNPNIKLIMKNKMIELFFYRNAKFIANIVTMFIPDKIIRKKIRKKILKTILGNKLIKDVVKILQKNQKPFIVYTGLFNWSDPMTQRPHHIFRGLANKGFIIFWPDYKVLKLTKVADNIYLFPIVCIDTMFNIDRDKIIYLVAHYCLVTSQYFILLLKQVKHLKIIYDYIDDLSLFSKNTQRECQEVLSFIKSVNAIFLASADKLYDELAKIVPKDRFLSIKNAVYIEDFHRKQYTLPIEMSSIVYKERPIVGYYGTISDDWFDFDLVEKLVKECRDLEFIFIGSLKGKNFAQQHSGNINKLKKYSSFAYFPPVKYDKLPDWAHYFDVAIIPFIVNDITEATSPLKLFEYMSMGLPIVTTDMHESRNYKSVMIAKNYKEFCEKIRNAISLKKSAEYQKLIKQDLKNNTWNNRIDDIEMKMYEKW